MNALDTKLYDATADQWWSDETRWIRTLKNMVPARLAFFDQFIDWQGKQILDLGCAGGFMAEAIARKGAIVSAIDPAAQAIAAAQAHAAQAGLSINYSVGAGENLAFEDAKFDAVVCVDVLEHVIDLNAVIGEIARVLKPGGIFLYDTINRNPLASLVTVTIAERILRILPQGTHDPRKFIKPEELRTLMRTKGLKPGQSTGLGPTSINKKGDFTFSRLPLNAIIYMGEASKP